MYFYDWKMLPNFEQRPTQGLYCFPFMYWLFLAILNFRKPIPTDKSISSLHNYHRVWKFLPCYSSEKIKVFIMYIMIIQLSCDGNHCYLIVLRYGHKSEVIRNLGLSCLCVLISIRYHAYNFDQARASSWFRQCVALICPRSGIYFVLICFETSR